MGPATTTVRVMGEDDRLPERTFGWWDMFVSEAEDPRSDGGWDNNERAVLLGFLQDRRITLELKCSGLNAVQMASQSVPPSDMSMLGLVRHLTSVESYWFCDAIAGQETQRPYCAVDGTDQSFTVEATDEAVEVAWSAWRAQVVASTTIIDNIADLGQLGVGNSLPIREVLVHLIREYAQHLGHADLIRERIDGRVGQ